MLIDVIAGAPDSLLIVAVSVYAACILHLVARDIERARWQRQFGGWRTLQQDRIDDRGAAGHRFACGAGWTVLQRHRLARRRCDRASW